MFQEQGQDGPDKRVLPVVFLVKKLEEKLRDNSLDFLRVVIITELRNEHQFADALNRNLSEDPVIRLEEVASDHFKKFVRYIIEYSMHDQSID